LAAALAILRLCSGVRLLALALPNPVTMPNSPVCWTDTASRSLCLLWPNRTGQSSLRLTGTRFGPRWKHIRTLHSRVQVHLPVWLVHTRPPMTMDASAGCSLRCLAQPSNSDGDLWPAYLLLGQALQRWSEPSDRRALEGLR